MNDDRSSAESQASAGRPRPDRRSRWDVTREGSVGIPVNERLGFEAGDVPAPQEEIVLHWTVPEEYVN